MEGVSLASLVIHHDSLGAQKVRTSEREKDGEIRERPKGENGCKHPPLLHRQVRHGEGLIEGYVAQKRESERERREKEREGERRREKERKGERRRD